MARRLFDQAPGDRHGAVTAVVERWVGHQGLVTPLHAAVEVPAHHLALQVVAVEGAAGGGHCGGAHIGAGHVAAGMGQRGGDHPAAATHIQRLAAGRRLGERLQQQGGAFVQAAVAEHPRIADHVQVVDAHHAFHLLQGECRPRPQGAAIDFAVTGAVHQGHPVGVPGQPRHAAADAALGRPHQPHLQRFLDAAGKAAQQQFQALRRFRQRQDHQIGVLGERGQRRPLVGTDGVIVGVQIDLLGGQVGQLRVVGVDHQNPPSGQALFLSPQ